MQILDLIYQEYLSKQEEARIDEQMKLYDYYIGNKDGILSYLQEALEETYDTETIEEMQLYFINITEKIINQLAIVYRDPAEYKVIVNGKVNEKLTEYLYEITGDKQNTVKKLAHRYAKLFNTSLTRVKFNKETNKIELSIEPSHLYRIEENEEDHYKIDVLSYDKYYENVLGKDEFYRVIWTKDRHYKKDAYGNEVSIGKNEKQINPYGIIPWATLRMKPSLGFWGEGLHDVAIINEMVNFLLTVLVNDNIVLGTSGTLYSVNNNLNKKGDIENGKRKIKRGWRHPLVVENARKSDLADPKFEHVTTNPQITEIRDTVDWTIKMIALSKGLNPNSFLEGVKATSGYSKIIDSLEQLEIRSDDIESCREYEAELFEIIKKINNVEYEAGGTKLQKIPEEAKILVDFAEIEIPKTQDEIQKEQEWDLQHNFTNYAQILMDKNPDLDEETAIKQIMRNKEINDRFNKQGSILDRIKNQGVQNGREQQL